MHIVTLNLEGRQIARLNPAEIVQIQARGDDQTLLWVKGDQLPMVVNLDVMHVQAEINKGLQGTEASELNMTVDTINGNLVAGLKDVRAMLLNVIIALGANLVAFTILIVVVLAHGK